MEKPYYGYRINKFITAVSITGGIVGIALAVAFTIFGYSTWLLVLCWVLGVIMFTCGVFSRLAFGFVNDPVKIKSFHDNFVKELRAVWDGEGTTLDIGTGLGRVAVEAARRFPKTRVIGVDTWTKKWGLFGMTKVGAEKNATIENVSDRCTFQYGNALELPFEDGQFQLVVSAFAFHEKPVHDRIVILKEAVRVLAPSGIFLICDIFPKGYKVRNIPELLKKVESIGVRDVKFVTLKEAGINFGGLAHIWQMGYLAGRKEG